MYLGNQPTEVDFSAFIVDTFNGDTSSVAFALSVSAANANTLLVHVDGVYNVPDVDYTVSGTIITFTSPPGTGTDNIVVLHLASVF